MIRTMFKISFRKMKRSYVLLFFTLLFCTAALAIALLMVRYNKLLEADRTLQSYGNYDIAFCEVTEELQQDIEGDKRFSELGYVYDFGDISFGKGGNIIALGALKDSAVENMYYVNPVQGRYPRGEGEICVDRMALKCGGYEEKLGQRIVLSATNQDGEIQEREYTLTGIIELQKQDSGAVYCTRKYPEKMFSLSNMNERNFPLAYISMTDAEKFYVTNKTHILVNVSSEENSGSVLTSYLGYTDTGGIDTSVTDKLHIWADHSLGREWTALCIMGNQLNNAYSSISDGVRQSVESGEVTEDAYTKYFIPLFIALIVIVSSIGIFDAVRLSVEEQRETYGILLGMGMTGRRILGHVIVIFLLLLSLAILLGWDVGFLGYQLILCGVRELFHLTLPSALSMDAYYEPFIKAVTIEPWFCSAVIACVVAAVAILGVAVDLLRMSPLRLQRSAIRKKKRRGREGGLYRILTRYVGQDSRINAWIPLFMVCVIVSVSVFGCLFFRAHAAFETSELTERLERTNRNGLDYYMKQSDAVYQDALQYMHQSGVTPQMFAELAENPAVKQAQGAIVNYSTALICDKEEMLAQVLQPQSEYVEAESNDTYEQLAVKANLQRFRELGVDTERQEVFQVPCVGIRTEDIAHFENTVIKGEIHPERLQSGEEVVVSLTDESLADFFEVGETLPLYDTLREEELDNSRENLMGQLPDKYKKESAAYSVSVNGETAKYWCNDTLKACPVRIGAVICIDAEEEEFFYEDAAKGYSVNLITGEKAFETWGLPNRNYTRIGVSLKRQSDISRFETVWLSIMQQAGYMDSIDAYAVLREKENSTGKIMAIFYSVLAVLLLIGILCAGNSLAMRMQRMEKEHVLLHGMGMTRGRILWWHIRHYSLYGIVGACVSVLPVTFYSGLVRYASRLKTEAYLADTLEVLEAQKPWVMHILPYDLMKQGFVPVVLTAGIVAVIVLAALVLSQAGRIGRSLAGGTDGEE